jgi:hypothetical protein
MINNGDTLSYVSVRAGIKYKETINPLTTDVTIKASTCGFEVGSGDTTFTQVEIEVKPLEVKERLCYKDLESKFLGQLMKPGAPVTVEEFGGVLSESYVKSVQKKNELNIWQGDLTGSTYTNFDGFIRQLELSTDKIKITGQTSFVAANIIDYVDAFVNSVPDDIIAADNLMLFVPYSDFKTYTAALRKAGLYQVSVENGKEFKLQIPGTNVTIKGTLGLTGTHKWTLAEASNLIVGTDMLNEEEKFDIWYSKDNDEVRVNIQWKMGTVIPFKSLVVTNY